MDQVHNLTLYHPDTSTTFVLRGSSPSFSHSFLWFVDPLPPTVGRVSKELESTQRPINRHIKDGWNIIVNKDAIHPNSGSYWKAGYVSVGPHPLYSRSRYAKFITLTFTCVKHLISRNKASIITYITNDLNRWMNKEVRPSFQSVLSDWSNTQQRRLSFRSWCEGRVVNHPNFHVC